MNKENLNISRIIINYLNNESSHSENEVLNEWLKKPENRKIFNEIKNTTYLSAKNASQIDFLKEKKDFFNLLEIKTKKNKFISINHFKYIAAVGLILIVFGVFLFMENSFNRQEIAENKDLKIKTGQPILITSEGKKVSLDEDEYILESNGIEVNIANNKINYNLNESLPKLITYNTIKVPNNGNYQFTMMDGTKVWLNSGTILKYPIPFHDNKRKVYLSGEAYFEVTKDTKKPFVVDVQQGKVKVLGTKFNVKTKTGIPIETTLVEGKVMVEDNNSNSMVLLPGQKSLFEDGKIKVSNVDTYEYTCWKDGFFLFIDKNLDEILNELSIWYGFEYFFQNRVQENREIRLKVKKFEHLRNVLELIEEAFHVKIKLKNNKSVTVSNK